MAKDKVKQEILHIFIEEATQLVNSLSITLEGLKNDFRNLNKIDKLKQDLHTLKGAAKMVHQSHIGDLAQELEVLIVALAKDKVTLDRQIFNLIGNVVLRFKEMLERIQKATKVLPAQDLIQKLQQYLPNKESSNEFENKSGNKKLRGEKIGQIQRKSFFPNKICVMVVDDSASVRLVTERILERNAYQVVTAKDGRDALKKLGVRIPDIIILDIDMPHMNGFELVEAIRKNEHYKKIPIVVATSSVEEHRKRAKALKLDNIIEKPYAETAMLNLIRGALGKNKPLL